MEDTQNYQIRMLTENKPSSFLKAELREWNAEAYMYFDIGSKQPLSVMYEKNTIGFDDLRCIVNSLNDAYDEAYRYLLDGNRISAKPELCYVRPGTNDYEWLFHPECQDNGFDEFAEFLIDKVSGYDKKCVETAHNIYKLIKTGNVTTKELVAVIENADVFTADDLATAKSLDTPQDKGGPTFELRDKERKDGFFAQIKEKLCGFKGKGDIQTSDGWLYETDCVEGIASPVCRETRIINLNEKKERRVLVGTGKKDRQEHELVSFPYVAGKMSEQADLILNSTLCSRIHARLTEEDGHIYLEDLNSTNGTFKNGFRLEAGEKVKLSPGDEIKFADITYVYE